MERAFLPADELRSLVLVAVEGGRPLALIGDHHPEVVAGLADAGWGVVELPSVLIVDTTLLLVAHLAGSPAIAVLGCPACHHDALDVVSDAASNAAVLASRHGATLVADVTATDVRAALAELLRSSPRRAPSSDRAALDDVEPGRRQQLAALLHDRDLDDASTVLAGFGHVEVLADGCTLCGACSRACPTGALDLTDGRLTARDMDCIGCAMCVSACPERVVELGGAVASRLLERRGLVADVVVPCAGCGGPHLPARLLERARATVAASGRPPTHASRQIDLCPSCRTLGPDGFRGIDDGRPAPVGVPQLDRRSFLTGTAAATVGGVIGMVALGSGPVGAAPRPDQEVSPGRLGMVIDIRRCIGCHACTAVCKAENHVPLDVNRDWVEEYVQGEYPNATPVFVPKLCNHCDDPGCLRACPTGAIFKRVDGIVDLDHTMCIGCRACNQACPYGCAFVDPVRHTADKCNLCSHRVDEGLRPACVDVCPSQCRVFGDLDDPDSAPRRVMADYPTTVLRPELGLGPNVHYVGLPSDPGRPTTATTVGDGRA